jgi:hypothetical protein
MQPFAAPTLMRSRSSGASAASGTRSASTASVTMAAAPHWRAM